MLATAIGETSSGKKIIIPSFVPDIGQMKPFSGFSGRDLFDVILAIEYVLLREMRKGIPRDDWMASLRLNRRYASDLLGEEQFAFVKETLGITTAFAARDYGRSLAYRHFKE